MYAERSTARKGIIAKKSMYLGYRYRDENMTSPSLGLVSLVHSLNASAINDLAMFALFAYQSSFSTLKFVARRHRPSTCHPRSHSRFILIKIALLTSLHSRGPSVSLINSSLILISHPYPISHSYRSSLIACRSSLDPLSSFLIPNRFIHISRLYLPYFAAHS